MCIRDRGLYLLAAEFGVHVQQPHAADLRDPGGLHLLGVGYGASQHLIAAADAEDQRTDTLNMNLSDGLPNTLALIWLVRKLVAAMDKMLITTPLIT